MTTDFLLTKCRSLCLRLDKLPWIYHFNRTRLSVQRLFSAHSRKKQKSDFWLLDNFAKKQSNRQRSGGAG